MCHNRLRRAFRQHQKAHDTGRVQKKPPRVDGDCLRASRRGSVFPYFGATPHAKISYALGRH